MLGRSPNLFGPDVLWHPANEGCIDQSYNENLCIDNHDVDGEDDDNDDDAVVPVARLFRVVER